MLGGPAADPTGTGAWQEALCLQMSENDVAGPPLQLRGVSLCHSSPSYNQTRMHSI